MQSFLKIFFKPHSILCSQTFQYRLTAFATGLRPVSLNHCMYAVSKTKSGEMAKLSFPLIRILQSRQIATFPFSFA